MAEGYGWWVRTVVAKFTNPDGTLRPDVKVLYSDKQGGLVVRLGNAELTVYHDHRAYLFLYSNEEKGSREHADD